MSDFNKKLEEEFCEGFTYLATLHAIDNAVQLYLTNTWSNKKLAEKAENDIRTLVTLMGIKDENLAVEVMPEEDGNQIAVFMELVPGEEPVGFMYGIDIAEKAVATDKKKAKGSTKPKAKKGKVK